MQRGITFISNPFSNLSAYVQGNLFSNIMSQINLLSTRLLQQTSAFLRGRYRRSPALAARHLGGAVEPSVRPRYVDPSCIRTVPRSPPVAARVLLLRNSDMF